MKVKTINKTIKDKVDDWLKSIKDVELRKKLKSDIVVTGGCIASMLLREPVNDFDIYFTTKESTVAVAKYYINQFLAENAKKHEGDRKKIRTVGLKTEGYRVRIHIKSAGILSAAKTGKYQYFELQDPENAEDYVDKAVQATKELPEDENKYRPLFLSDNAITLSGKIQIIVRFHGNPEEIHKNFDFVHCTNYWTPKTGVVTKKEALECLLTKELRYVGSLYPFCSVVRTRKFINKGWTINAGQYLKMALQISELDLNDPEVLKDQLIGVDIAYFMEIIQIIKQKMEKDGEKRLSQTYLISIIDKIF